MAPDFLRFLSPIISLRRSVEVFRQAALFFALACLSVLPAGAATVDCVAARINGEIVTEGDLYEALRERGHSSLSPEFLGSYFDQKLLLQEAKRQQISVPDSELQRQVEETVRELRGKYPGEKEFRHALAEEGLNLEKLKANLLKRARTDHQVFQAVTAGTLVTEQDVVEYEKTVAADGRSPASLRLRRLAVPVKKKGGAAAACEEVRELAQRISTEGLSFEDGVRRYSAVPGAKEDGGDLGWMELSQLSEQVVAATKDLKPGQASVPIVTGGFASIFYVEGKRGGRAHLLESRFNERRAALLYRLRRQSQIEIYTERIAGLLPKEYASHARIPGAGTVSAPAPAAQPAGETGARKAVQPAAETPAVRQEEKPEPTPAPRKGLMRLFRRGE